MTRSWKRPVLRIAIWYSTIVAILCLLTFIFPLPPLVALVLFGLTYTGGFKKLRFTISRPLFESAAQHCLAEAKATDSPDYSVPARQDFMIGYFISSAELR